jgi:hypothetical protein
MLVLLAVQMIARIHTSVVPVRRMIHGLLIRIGRHHPQASLTPRTRSCAVIVCILEALPKPPVLPACN